MNSNDLWLHRLEKLGAVWRFSSSPKPHVKTSISGKHVDAYFNSDVVYHDKELFIELVASVVSELKRRNVYPEIVVGHLPYTKHLAEELARQIGAHIIFSEPSKNFKLNASAEKGSRVLVVSDEIYTGSSTKGTIQELMKNDLVLYDIIICIANMSNSEMLDGREVISSIAIPTHHYKSEECRLCKEGSEAFTPRENWNSLTSSSLP